MKISNTMTSNNLDSGSVCKCYHISRTCLKITSLERIKIKAGYFETSAVKLSYHFF